MRVSDQGHDLLRVYRTPINVLLKPLALPTGLDLTDSVRLKDPISTIYPHLKAENASVGVLLVQNSLSNTTFGHKTPPESWVGQHFSVATRGRLDSHVRQLQPLLSKKATSEWFKVVSPESQNQILVLTVLLCSTSLDSGNPEP